MKLLIIIVALVSVPAAEVNARGLGLDPANFSTKVDNEWFPLAPGTVYVYTGVKDGKPARDVVTVSARTTKIAGFPCAVVEDDLYLAGRLHERTTDWYSQDHTGTVWYFGEKTAELDKAGHVTSTEGSWRTGVGGAKPGIFMPAHPKVGVTHRQEFYKGHAEDYFEIVSIFTTVTSSPADNALLTKEWTPLEPNVLDHKLYVRGIGNVVERTVRGGDEHLELLSMRRG
jgi:hypothetical protein